MSERSILAVDHLLQHCGTLKRGDQVLILADKTTEDLGRLFTQRALNVSSRVQFMDIPELGGHGMEPPREAASAMLNANLIVSLCRFSLAHSEARMMARENGARFLSLPLYSWELLSDPAITFDYKAQAPIVRFITDAFTNGERAHVSGAGGTDIELSIKGRKGNYCPGFVDESSFLGSPPDIESNVSPIEEASSGKVTVDGSITTPTLGLLRDHVRLTVQGGAIVSIESANRYYVEELNRLLGDAASPRRVLGECGVGLNPAARLQGMMLTDEGALGCIHFGFGSNFALGGKNKIAFHLDFVFRKASLYIDGRPILIEGKVIVP